MPYKDPKNPKNLAYRKKYYEENKNGILKESRKKAKIKYRKSTKGKVWLKNNYEKNRDKYLAYFHSEEYRKHRAEIENEHSKKLSEWYIKKQLIRCGFTSYQLKKYPDIIEVYRLQLIIKRTIKSIKNEK